jgi:hypothetical protein
MLCQLHSFRQTDPDTGLQIRFSFYVPSIRFSTETFVPVDHSTRHYVSKDGSIQS